MQIIFITDFREQAIIENTGWTMIGACTLNIFINFILCISTNIISKCRKKPKVTQAPRNLEEMMQTNPTSKEVNTSGKFIFIMNVYFALNNFYLPFFNRTYT